MATSLAPANEVSVNSPFGHDVAADNPRLQAVTLLIIVGLGTVMVMLLSFMFKDIGNEGSLTHDLLVKSLAWKRDQRLLSEAYRHAINRTADPCVDFERFVCGSTDSTHVLQNMQSRALAEAGRQLAQVLVPAVKGSGVNLTAVQKAASLYQLCVSLSSLEDDAAPKMSALLRKLGLGWPPNSPGFIEETRVPTRTEAEALLLNLIALSLRWGMHTLLRCQVEPERNPQGVLVLTVGIGNELSDWLKARTELQRLGTYNEALIAVVAAFRWPGGRPQASSVVRSVASADRLLSALISNTRWDHVIVATIFMVSLMAGTHSFIML